VIHYYRFVYVKHPPPNTIPKFFTVVMLLLHILQKYILIISYILFKDLL